LPGNVAAVTSLTGEEIWRMFAQAALWLRTNIPRINAINVFPVPDGDTGFNMSATLDAAVDMAAPARSNAGSVTRSLAHGALLGARGNSGVILSQVLAGFAAATETLGALDGTALARAFGAAETFARRAVAQPREGTMLTLLAEVAEATNECGTAEVRDVLAAAVVASRGSVARSPELLPMLQEAGVVDAGAFGLQIILEGCLQSLDGAGMPALPAESEGNVRPNPMRAGRRSEDWATLGYCTEFLIHGSALGPEALITQLRSIGDSVIAVGGDTLVRVHVHTADPGAALSLGIRYGALDRIKIDNIDAQHRAFAGEEEPAEIADLCVVAIVAGDGFAELFRQYGSVVVANDQTADPGVVEVVRVLNRCGCASVILLPNSPYRLDAAEQAASLSERAVTVVPTASLPQGIAALLAFSPARGPVENVSVMREAADRVRTIELTRATRSARSGGSRSGDIQLIGLLDGRQVASGATWPEVAAKAVSAIEGRYETAAIFYGEGAGSVEAEEIASALRERCAGVDVQTVRGGQIASPFIIAVE
jgi:DAK2 domain fusion protein YloV